MQSTVGHRASLFWEKRRLTAWARPWLGQHGMTEEEMEGRREGAHCSHYSSHWIYEQGSVLGWCCVFYPEQCCFSRRVGNVIYDCILGTVYCILKEMCMCGEREHVHSNISTAHHLYSDAIKLLTFRLWFASVLTKEICETVKRLISALGQSYFSELI